LAQRSWVAQQRYFSWTVIARQYAEFLGESRKFVVSAPPEAK
jgi:hypothetical protein